MSERDNPAVPKRAYVQLPASLFALDDEEATAVDEAIADALLEQLGIMDE